MPLLSKVWNSFRRTRGEDGSARCLVRAIPGAIPRSPLEHWVQEVLAGQPTCPLTRLVSEVAEYLRRSEWPSLLASLDEGLWGGWVWPALAREELRHLEGHLLVIEAAASRAGDNTVRLGCQRGEIPPRPVGMRPRPHGASPPLAKGGTGDLLESAGGEWPYSNAL